jgi:hypothetical protein
LDESESMQAAIVVAQALTVCREPTSSKGFNAHTRGYEPFIAQKPGEGQ